MPRPKINLGVGNTGLYRPIGNLPDINQPDTLSVEKYIGAPFYAYMFLSAQKQEDLRKESVAELLSKPEAVNFYVERMSRDLKLQKAAMAATLLRTTYVKMKELRKFIWQHKNAEKVIARDDLGQLPAFKRMLTRFVLLNYCAMNTPGVSGAEWVPEKHPKSAFDSVNDAYKKEFTYFEWQGENCRLRHPNPLGGHPKVNFSAYTDDTSNGRVFVMDVSKHDLVNEINTVNAQIFELLSQYLGSLSIPPSTEDLEREGVHYKVETPEVFEPISAKETRPNEYYNAKGKELDQEAMVERVTDLRKQQMEAEMVERRQQRAAAAAEHKKALAAEHKKALPASKKGSSSSKAPPQLMEEVEEEETPEVPVPTVKEAASALGVKEDSPEFLEQEKNLKGGLAMASVGAYLQQLADIDIKAEAEAVFEGSGITKDEVNVRVDALGAALYKTGLFKSKEDAGTTAWAIITKGLAKYKQGGNALKDKSKGFVAFTKKGRLSKISADKKAGQATRIVRKMLTRGKFNPDAALASI